MYLILVISQLPVVITIKYDHKDWLGITRCAEIKLLRMNLVGLGKSNLCITGKCQAFLQLVLVYKNDNVQQGSELLFF